MNLKIYMVAATVVLLEIGPKTKVAYAAVRISPNADQASDPVLQSIDLRNVKYLLSLLVHSGHLSSADSSKFHQAVMTYQAKGTALSWNFKAVDTSKAGMDFFTKLADVGTKNLATKENMKALLKILQLSTNLLPVLSLGLGFASSLFLLGIDSDRAWMLEQFDKVNLGIRKLDEKLDDIAIQMESLHIQGLAFSPLQQLKVTSSIINSNRMFSHGFDDRLEEVWKSGRHLQALKAIYNLVKGDVLHNSLLNPTIQSNDLKKLLEISTYLTAMVNRGFLDYVIVAKSYFMQKGNLSEVDADAKARFVCTEEFKGDNDIFVSNINKAIDTIKENAEGALKKYMDDIVEENSQSSSQELCERSFSHIKDKYFWKSFLIGFYNMDWYNSRDHWSGTFPLSAQRVHDKTNWYIIWQDIDDDNNDDNAQNQQPDQAALAQQVASIADSGWVVDTTKKYFIAMILSNKLKAELHPTPKNLVVVMTDHYQDYHGLSSDESRPPYLIRQRFTIQDYETYTSGIMFVHESHKKSGTYQKEFSIAFDI